jgi:hypothetical protein
MPEKGEEIRFVRGVYVGCVGWINKSRKNKKSSYRHVIVALEGEEKATRVKKSSLRKKFKAPRTYEEACLQQHSDIELAMIQLAEMFSQCHFQDNNNVLQLLNDELVVACDIQSRLGSKGHY